MRSLSVSHQQESPSQLRVARKACRRVSADLLAKLADGFLHVQLFLGRNNRMTRQTKNRSQRQRQRQREARKMRLQTRYRAGRAFLTTTSSPMRLLIRTLLRRLRVRKRPGWQRLSCNGFSARRLCRVLWAPLPKVCVCSQRREWIAPNLLLPNLSPSFSWVKCIRGHVCVCVLAARLSQASTRIYN